MASENRESLASRLGFLLVSAGCAIGLGNVWRFPYITGEYGGAWFVLLFVVCTFAVMPVMIAEFAIGRASRRNLGLAYHVLEPKGTSWHKLGWWAIVGSYLLLMFYTTVTGWLILYCWYMISGTLTGLSPEGVQQFFGQTLSSPSSMILGMTLSIAIAFGVCWLGLQAGVERIVKILMAGLFLILIMLVIKSLTLSGADEGLRFYLMPNWENMEKTGFLPIFSAALNQAFFALSVGIGAMTVFGSYLNRKRSLPGEVLIITGLDFMVAVLAGRVLLFNEKITHMSKRTTREKLLSYLSSESIKQGKLSFDIPYDRQQLADYLCVERAAMSVELSKLQKEGLLKTKRNHFELCEVLGS